MSKVLTRELIAQKTKNNQIERVKTINLWGNDIEDISIISKMDSLEICSLSLNRIRTLKPFYSLPNLKELYLRQNLISDFSELYYLRNCPRLEVLWLSQNPIADSPNYRAGVIKILPHLEKLDNQNITDSERMMSEQMEGGNAAYEADIRMAQPVRRLMSEQQHNRYYKDPLHNQQKYAGQYNAMDYFMQDPMNNGYDRRLNNYRENNPYEDFRMGNEERHKAERDEQNELIERNLNRRSAHKHKEEKSFQGSNVMNCLVMLLDELNDNELEYIKGEIDKKISNI